MTPMQSTLIDEFWSLIRKIERDIHGQVHASGRDMTHWWTWELEDAHEEIMPLLFSISHSQQFHAPDDQMKTGGPFKAENAHEALVSCLTSEVELKELLMLLNSSEYKELRKKAADEVRWLNDSENIPVARPVLPKVGAMIWDESYETQWVLPPIEPTPQCPAATAESFLRDLTPTQRRIYDVIDEAPQRGEDIAKLVDCEYDTARRYLPALVKRSLIKKCRSGYYREP